MSIFKRKENYNYFDNFLSCAKIAGESARYLCRVFEDFAADDVPAHADAMHKLEHQADVLKHESSRHLAREFITPIELEDIAMLSQELDNIVDSVEDIIRRIYMLNVTHLRPEAIDFARLIAQCCDEFVNVIAELKNFKKSKTIVDHIVSVNELENRGDQLHEKSLRRLFSENSDTRTLLIWMTIFEALEHCLDACENAADIVHGIIMKNT